MVLINADLQLSALLLSNSQPLQFCQSTISFHLYHSESEKQHSHNQDANHPSASWS
jgi:hypothetical protein